MRANSIMLQLVRLNVEVNGDADALAMHVSSIVDVLGGTRVYTYASGNPAVVIRERFE